VLFGGSFLPGDDFDFPATPIFLFLTFVFSPWDFYSLGQRNKNKK